MPDGTGFDHDLAEAVAAATRDVRLAPAADVIRLGRRRERARRGRLAVAGVAVLGGAYGAAGLAGATTAPKPAFSAEAHGAGVLPVEQWPGYATEHWRLKNVVSMYGIAPWLMTTSVSLQPPGEMDVRVMCERGSTPSVRISLAGRPLGTVQIWETVPKDGQQFDPTGVASVYTYSDASSARQALTDMTEVLKAPCPAGGRVTPRPGATTGYGVSWVDITGPAAKGKGPAGETHQYLVVVGDQVATLAFSDFGSEFSSTAHDMEVLAGMRAALAGRSAG